MTDVAFAHHVPNAHALSGRSGELRSTPAEPAVSDLTVSLINHSNPELLRGCLQSILAGPGVSLAEMCVVDNATGGRLIEELQAEFPSVRWILNERRKGFSANHNQVLRRTSSWYVCVLNDDTVVHDGALEELVRFMDGNPRVAVAGPRLLNPDGSIQNSTFHDKSLLGELIGICLLPGPLNRLKTTAIDPAQFCNVPALVDWLLGACLLVRREAYEQVGLLDEVLSPIANVEEIDWCRRFRMAGWGVAFVPSARVTHVGGQSMKRERPGADPFRVEMHRVTLAYFRKHFGRMSEWALRAIYIGTLPWNGMMLLQSWLRGRTGRAESAGLWATYVGIARQALRPHGYRGPSC